MRLSLAVALFCLVGTTALAQDEYQVAMSDEPIPDAVAADIAAVLTPKCYAVTSGDEAVCHIWLRSEWPVQSGFTPTFSMLYPLSVGELVGVVEFPEGSIDFRGQEIEDGVYTLRYGLQPEDGNHVGTSDTRDFLLLVPASEDQSVSPMDEFGLFEMSKLAANSTHPAMYAMLAVEPGSAAPGMRHDSARELWAVRLENPTSGGEKLTIELVVIGHTTG